MYAVAFVDFAHQDTFGQLQLQARRRQAGVLRMVAMRVPSWPSENCRAEMFTDDLRHAHLGLVPGLELAAGFADHPVADVHHQAQLLDHPE